MAIERIAAAIRFLAETFLLPKNLSENFSTKNLSSNPITRITNALGLTPSKISSKQTSIPLIRLTQVPTPSEAASQRSLYTLRRLQLTLASQTLQSSLTQLASLKEAIGSAQLLFLKFVANKEIGGEEKIGKKRLLEERLASLATAFALAEKKKAESEKTLEQLKQLLRGESPSLL